MDLLHRAHNNVSAYMKKHPHDRVHFQLTLSKIEEAAQLLNSSSANIEVKK